MKLRPVALGFCLLTIATLPARGQSSSDPTQVFSGEVAPGAWLRIRNLSGSVEVHQAPGRTAVVSATRRMDRGGSDEIRFDVRRDGANVTVCAIWPRTTRCDASGYDYDSRGREDRSVGRVDLSVALPKGVKLLAATGNGEVEVRGAGAEVEARSGNGEVTVRGAAGRVTIASGNGDLRVDDARGDVKASTGNGDIRVSTSVGPVSARTGNGGIEVEMASLSGGSDMDFSTGNGSIEVSFPSDLSAMIEANVPFKNLRTDFPMEVAGRWNEGRTEGKIGNGGRRIRFSTGNGRVTIQKI